MADLRVDIASEFTGKAAFTKAQKATSSLDKAVGKLGKQIASVFAITKIVAYGKASVQAFVEEERAVSQLTTAVKNLGLAFAQPQINNYIDRLQSSTAIVDDELRPAFQALLTTTGSLTKSQELLSLAIEGSRGSGIALTTVSQDLANAYNGNTRGLRKYNLGLSKAQLTTISFTEVQQRFANQFSGANAAYLDTYAGKLDVLKVASETAKEVIGQGLVDALVLAGGKSGDIQNVSDAMASLAEYTADTTRGMGVLVSKITQLNEKVAGGALGKIISGGFNLGLIGVLRRLGNEAQERPQAGRRFMGGAQANLYSASEAAEKKRQQQQKKLADAQTKAAKALTAEQKKQAALKKAGSIFDLEQVQLIAALKGKLSDEDRKRVELQFAILTGNTKQAQQLTYELAIAQGLGKEIAKDLATLPDAKNPFAAWDAYLDMLMEKARKVVSTSGTAIGGYVGTVGVSNAQIAANLSVGATLADLEKTASPWMFGGQAAETTRPVSTNVASLPSSGGGMSSQFGSDTPWAMAVAALNRPVVVQIDGKAVSSSLQNSSLSGIGLSVNRTGR
jgi:hypothetical protein